MWGEETEMMVRSRQTPTRKSGNGYALQDLARPPRLFSTLNRPKPPEPACGPPRDSHSVSGLRALLFRLGCRFLSRGLHRCVRLRCPELRIPRGPLLRGITDLRVEREDVRLDGEVRVGRDRLELLGVLLALSLLKRLRTADRNVHLIERLQGNKDEERRTRHARGNLVSGPG